MHRVSGISVLLAALLVYPSANLSANEYDRYFERIQPIFTAHCVSCHGPNKSSGKLRLDTSEGFQRGGASGPAIDPAHPNQSLLLKAIRHEENVAAMPPKEHLKEAEIAALAEWVRAGAHWPDPVQVLFDSDATMLDALTGPDGSAKLEALAAGRSALVISGQKLAERVPGWNFAVREKPKLGEYRYLRFSWKKRGGQGMMLEFARDGTWRNQGETNASWVAGENTTGWPAIVVADDASNDWAVVTRDLWRDGGNWGDWNLTGLCINAIAGGEVVLDTVILGRSVESLDAYKPGRGLPAFTPTPTEARRGDAWSDAANPIRTIFHGERLDLWSLRSPRRTSVDKSPQSIDRFVEAKLREAGLSLSAQAERRALIRRVSFDITGLPPTFEEVQAFVANDRPDAYERLVDKLLASPRFGEKWGRAWLDVVRYADTNGFERDEFRPTMYRYRDYVIASLNADKPFDRFVTEQLAGDELKAGPVETREDIERMVATGFLRLGTFDSTTSLFTEDKKGRDELMADLANTTGSAFLGQTMSCCQCHNHKYDPLSQADHFRLRAFFAAVSAKDDFPVSLALERTAVEKHNAAVDRKIEAKQREHAALLQPTRAKLEAAKLLELREAVVKAARTGLNLPAVSAVEKIQAFPGQIHIDDPEATAALPAASQPRAKTLTDDIARLTKTKRELPTARVMTDTGRIAPPTNIFFQGDFTQPREEVVAGFPSVLDPNPAAITRPTTETTGRRLALARWIASRENPWTARVIVNRIWQGYFGRGLVATPNDLGFAGTRPSHPELLDWLACQLMDHGWSLKHIHRQIVLSATYRQGAGDNPAGRQADPRNQLYWRQEVRRLDAESMRDALLAASGSLLPVDSGPPRWPPVAEAVLEVQPAILEARHDDGGRLQNWYAEPAATTDVRSVFLVQKRSVPLPLLVPFDLPDTTVSCARRSSTTVAPQALTLLNNPDMQRWSRAFAERIDRAAATAKIDVIDAAFRFALQRDPADDERTLARDLLRRHEAKYADDDAKKLGTPHLRALTDLARALLNTNEFIYID